MTTQELEDRLIDFASRIIDIVEALPKGLITRHLGGQLVRSGTSPALNYGEARGAVIIISWQLSLLKSPALPTIIPV